MSSLLANETAPYAVKSELIYRLQKKEGSVRIAAPYLYFYLVKRCHSDKNVII